ncbi:Uncharacterised protein at_DN0934 [Pycnogonum litorale]
MEAKNSSCVTTKQDLINWVPSTREEIKEVTIIKAFKRCTVFLMLWMEARTANFMMPLQCVMTKMKQQNRFSMKKVMIVILKVINFLNISNQSSSNVDEISACSNYSKNDAAPARSTIGTFVDQNDVLKAEVLWMEMVLHTISSHHLQ